MQQGLYQDWWQWLARSTPEPKSQYSTLTECMQEVSVLEDSLKQSLDKAQKALSPMTLRRIPAPPFWIRKDPHVVIAGGQESVACGLP